MKIEFRKVPQTKKEFTASLNSVKLEGTFSKITPSLVKVEAQLSGNTPIQCSRCGANDALKLDETVDFLLSDGIYNQQTDDLVIEITNSVIDFDEIIQSEVESIQSDYNYCNRCSESSDLLEQEI
jgi:uncharacterized metal-binding protein YceD (DUF177 family)